MKTPRGLEVPSPLFPRLVEPMRTSVVYRCGHRQEEWGASEAELQHYRDLANHFDCVACTIEKMYQKNR